MQTKLPFSQTTRNKGKQLSTYPKDYTIIDIETTGLSSTKNEIIELSALKVRQNQVIDTFSTLVKPQSRINYFISNLTGITNEMVENAPSIENVLNKYLDFISNDVVIGHNVNFDINFIYDKSIKCYNKEFSNDYVDTCKISRRITALKKHSLDSVAQYYNVDSSGHHRAENDCHMTFEIYKAMIKDTSLIMEECKI